MFVVDGHLDCFGSLKVGPDDAVDDVLVFSEHLHDAVVTSSC